MPTPAEFDRLRVVLVATRNPLNIGAAARAMSNFGFLNLCLVNPYDPSFREARSAVGASQLLAKAQRFDTIDEAVAGCKLVIGTTAAGAQRELRHPLKRLEQAAPQIRKRLKSSNVAILFGSEKFGLSNDDLSHCNYLVRIPTREAHRSVNLGQAVAICLYELIRDARATGPSVGVRGRSPDHKSATAGDVERVTALLMEALESSGSLQVRSEAGTRAKVRRLLLRHKLSSADVEFWLGMLRQITWALRNPPAPTPP